MFTKNLKELDKNDAAIAGGKGASLGEMTNAGIPVPPGFVVLAGAFEKFLEITDLNVEIESILATADTQKMHTVEKASERIQALILGAKMPVDIEKEIQKEYRKLDAQFVAVRSSATAEDGAEAAWAGQLESYLNATEKDLLKNVQRCWASLFTPRAIFYRFEKHYSLSTLPEGGIKGCGISVAVVVQKMIQSEKSGIAFSVHPVIEDYNQLIIEAGYGLGEAIVSGSITPDSYVVNKLKIKNAKLKAGEAIIDVNVSTQTKALYGKNGGGNEWRDIPEPQASSQVLNKKEILELSDLIIKIENHYNFPCDIEWALEDGKFYITQSRPITTLKSFKEDIDRNKACDVIFEKVFVRDLTFLLASSGFYDYPNFDRNSDHILLDSPVLKQVDGNVVEFWIQTKIADKWLCRLGEELVNDSVRLSKIMNDYEKISKKIKKVLIKKEPKILDIIHLCELFKTFKFSNYLMFESSIETGWPKEFCNWSEIQRKNDDILWSQSDTFIRNILSKNGFSMNQIKRISPEELIKFEKGDLEIDSMRKEGVFVEDCDFNIYFEPISVLANKNGFSLLEHEVNSVKEIKGEIAYRGKVNGHVKKVFTREDIGKVNNGDILFTPMTTPDFMLAIKKASAFVTDEGGIMCHAAIFAREMKKPCIIGTKIATQVLHDGDLVEVDADVGVVRILEKNDNSNDKENNGEDKYIEKEEYIKFFNRGMCLISCQAYDRGERIELFEASDGRFFMDPVFVKVPHKGTDMYFNFTDPSQNPEPLIKFFNDNPNELLRLKEEFDKNFLKARDILKNQQNFDINGLFQLIVKLLPLFALGNMFGDERENIQGIKSELIDIYRKIRKQSDGLMQSFDAKIMHILEKIVPHEYAKYLEYLTLEEVIEKQYPLLDMLKERQAGYIFHKGNLHVEVALEEYAANNKYEFVPFRSEKEIFDDVMEGSVAYNGIARGFVKILFEDADAAKIKKSDILVASMTTPNFIVAMKKAAAFVTDEGGVTCHASIIAREMKKPCIIGTKIATQVLKDGDLVEVDAERGVVKILEKADAGSN